MVRMQGILYCYLLLLQIISGACSSSCFLGPPPSLIGSQTSSRSGASRRTIQWSTSSNDRAGEKKKDNKAMAFLKKIGKVGGAANKDYRFALGVDEGPSGKSAGSAHLRKSKASFKSCTESGVVDDMSESFPTTSSGTEWNAFSDQVMGGCSTGHVSRELFEGKPANVLHGKVRLANNGGFIQMATNLALDPSTTVDASKYDGVELDVRCRASGDSEKFNIHLKTDVCPKPFSSYRASFEAPVDQWATVRVPFDEFKGHGPGATENPFDTSALRRVGVVAIGREMDVTLAVSGVRFYSKP